MSSVERPRLTPVPALDGLRGLAVAAVVLFHFPTHRFVPGGQFGVDVFFVLSGFLVTALLLGQREAHGRLDVTGFLIGRGRRLVPALIALLAVFLLGTAVFGASDWFTSDPLGARRGAPLSLPRALGASGAGLSGTYNLVLAAGHRGASPLGHLWTLAVEAQFYLFWALVLRLLASRRRLLFLVTLLAAAGSALLPFLLWHGGAGANAIYFGTLPRLQQLLAGAATAQLWFAGRLGLAGQPAGRLLAGGCAGVLVAVVFEVGNQPFKFLGAFSVTALAASVLVAHLVMAGPRALGHRLLAGPVLGWLGRRSYGIYLWHWPLAEWTNRLAHPLGVPLGIGASLVAAELSFRWVERPTLARSWSRTSRPARAARWRALGTDATVRPAAPPPRR